YLGTPLSYPKASCALIIIIAQLSVLTSL
ncbi:MAG: hypothetical protein EZS28_044969, partial [Streblomastix strix]